MSRHLDPAKWSAFLEQRLAPIERSAVLAHLEEPCEECEAFLAGQGVDALDGLVDDALLAISAQQDGVIDQVGAKRFERAIKPQKPIARYVALIGAAASIALAFVLLREAPTERLKGAAAEQKVVLEVLRTRNGAIESLARRAQVFVGDTILFRVRVEEEVCFRLWRRPNLRPLVDQPICVPRGVHVIESAGEVLGLRLEERGPIEILAGISPENADIFPLLVEPVGEEVP